MKYTHYRSAALLDRLCHAANRRDRPIIFLVGSPLCVPDHPGGHGVPGVDDMIDLVRDEFQGTPAAAELEQETRDHPNPYQRAFEFLHARRGQDTVNRIVRTAVWCALDAGNWPPSLPDTTPEAADAATCRALEREPAAWILPSAVDLFGELLVTCSDTFGSAVLTTNFDPLIQIAIFRHHGQCYRTVLHGDGTLGQTAATGTHIVHLHGYWCDYDTLHTPQQLLNPRPQLTRSLAQVIRTSTLVVIGYGGWDDVITRTLIELLEDPSSNPEILWAFHGDDPQATEKTHERFLTYLQPGIGRGRVSLYHGVTCHAFFSELLRQLTPNYPATTSASPRVTTEITEERPGPAGAPQVRIAIDFPLPLLAPSDPDSPLLVTPWAGRPRKWPC